MVTFCQVLSKLGLKIQIWIKLGLGLRIGLTNWLVTCLGGWKKYYICESPHKDRSRGMCNCVFDFQGLYEGNITGV